MERVGLLYHPNLIILFVFANDFAVTFESFDSTISRPNGHFVLADDHLDFRPPRFGVLYHLSVPSMLFAAVDAALRRRGSGQYTKPVSNNLTPSDREEIFRLLQADGRALPSAFHDHHYEPGL